MTWDIKASTSSWLTRWRTWHLLRAELRQRWSPHFLFLRLYIVQITSFKRCLHSHNHVCISNESRGQLSPFWVGHQWVCCDRPVWAHLVLGRIRLQRHQPLWVELKTKKWTAMPPHGLSEPRYLTALIGPGPHLIRIFLNIFLQPSGGSGAFMTCVHGMLGNLAKLGQSSYNNFITKTHRYYNYPDIEVYLIFFLA